MKKLDEKNVRELERFGVVTACLLPGLCIVFLLDIFRNQWMLDFVLILGFLLHLSYALICLVRRIPGLAAVMGAVCLACIGFLIYFMIV